LNFVANDLRDFVFGHGRQGAGTGKDGLPGNAEHRLARTDLGFFQHIAQQFRVSADLAARALEGMSDYELATRPDNKANSAQWVFGHITAYRFRIGQLMGLSEEFPWGDLFDRSKAFDRALEYPSVDDLKGVFEEICRKVDQQFEMVSEDRLMAEVDFTVHTDESIGVVFAPGVQDNSRHWHFRLHRPTTEHVVAVALRRNGDSEPGVVLRDFGVDGYDPLSV